LPCGRGVPTENKKITGETTMRSRFRKRLNRAVFSAASSIEQEKLESIVVLKMDPVEALATTVTG